MLLFGDILVALPDAETADRGFYSCGGLLLSRHVSALADATLFIPALILLTNSYCRRRNTAPLLCRRPEFESQLQDLSQSPPLLPVMSDLSSNNEAKK